LEHIGPYVRHNVLGQQAECFAVTDVEQLNKEIFDPYVGQRLKVGYGLGRRPHMLWPDERMAVVVFAPDPHARLVTSQHQRRDEVGPQDMFIWPTDLLAVSLQ
jgi:hypothetical protein